MDAGSNLPVIYRAFQFTHRITLLHKRVVVPLLLRNIGQYLLFQSQLRYLERQGSQRSDQLLTYPAVVDMQREPELLEERDPCGARYRFDPPVIVMAEKDPVQHIQEVIFIL